MILNNEERAIIRTAIDVFEDVRGRLDLALQHREWMIGEGYARHEGEDEEDAQIIQLQEALDVLDTAKLKALLGIALDEFGTPIDAEFCAAKKSA